MTIYREMGDEDIAWLVSAWADVADRIARAGAEAIEIHMAHVYFLGVFLGTSRQPAHRCLRRGAHQPGAAGLRGRRRGQGRVGDRLAGYRARGR